MANAGYTFLPWLRFGMAGGITRPDGTMTGAPRASVPVTLAINASGEARPVTIPLSLYGPGEVAGIDPRLVIRQWPPPGTSDAPLFDLPMVELSQPDLPWRYTPATANAQARVRPWLVLAVLRDDEILSETPAGADGRLPAIVVAGSALPHLDQSWAWSHVQVEGFDPATETLADVVRLQPQRVRSRLLAPRRLAMRTGYTAVLVPAFERGRRAGLREPLPEDVDGLVPAWTGASAQVHLPVYLRWSFHTGAEATDFELLARRLTARQIGPDVGQRDLDVRTPDPALPPASAQPLALSGALVSAVAPTPWPPAEREPFVAALATLLNASFDALEGRPTVLPPPPPPPPPTPPPPSPEESAQLHGGPRFVAPPLWGRWHAALDRLDPDAGPNWFHELNADPRLRATAGLGAEVVRRNQEQLMAAAWDQLEGVLEANEALRRAQLAREAATKLRDNHLARLDTETLVGVSGPLHARFKTAGTTTGSTFHAMVAASPIPDGALDGQLRRVTRPAGPVARRSARHAGASTVAGESGLLSRLNQGELRARPPVPVPDHPNMTESVVPPGIIPPEARVPPHGWQPVIGGWRQGVSRAASAIPIPPPDPDPNPEPSEAVQRFLIALDNIVTDTTTPPGPGPVLTPVNLTAVATTLLDKVDPRVTIPAGIHSRLRLADWIPRGAEDPLEPIMAAPEFAQPMYEALRDISQDWLMSGAGTIPSETVTLLVSNQSFIEAYLAGLNHEMARELLYHEYPTDQRGTYFRQFWDSRTALSPGGTPPDPESQRDITPMHTWHRDRGLGENSGRNPAPEEEDHIVLLIRGEVLRHYPTTIVYAVQTVLDESGERTLGTQTRYPIFLTRLEPDLMLFGFDLVPSQVRDAGTGAGDQGWYFLLSEHPGEARFGLDIDNGEYAGRPIAWRDLNWAHLATDAAALEDLNYLDLNQALPDTSGIVPGAGEPALAWHGPDANGSDLAWITLQPPFRVAIHGSDILPEDPA